MTTKNTTAKCRLCGTAHETRSMVKVPDRIRRNNAFAYICQHCATENMGYHAVNRNEMGELKVLGTPKASGVKTGLEVETSFSDLIGRLTMFEYGCIPTHDSSIRSEGEGCRYRSPYGSDRNGCEYVSAIMHGLNMPSKMAKTFDWLINEGHLKMNDSCGMHFHISVNDMKDAHGRQVYMDYIRRFCNSLFVPLTNELARDAETCIKVFGRTFNDYAEPITASTQFKCHNDRYHFINCMADNNIEFRLNKFVNGDQLQNLMKMEVEMVECLVKYFCEKFNNKGEGKYKKNNPVTLYRNEIAKDTAEKLVKIYRKYSANI